MINIQLEKMEAAVLALYLESLREGIEKKPINNLNEQIFLAAEKNFSTQIPFEDIQDEVINELDQLHEIYSKKQIKTISIPGKKNLIDRALYHTPRPVGILMHPNGLYAFVANSNADKIEVIDMKTFTLVSTIGTGRVPDGLTFVE